MKHLVGHTGLIGKTIQEQENFDYLYNSKNINDLYWNCEDGDELFLTCLPATKWMVNKDLRTDMTNIYQIINHIPQITFSKVTLISTIDVYNDSPLKSDEDYPINVKNLSYGNNRYIFELLITNFLKYDNLKIFRLPALFNKHIKKNVLYDLINNNNINQINVNSSYQWYNLDYLSRDISHYFSILGKENVVNLFTEPIETSEIVNLFPNLIDSVSFGNRVEYNYYTKYCKYPSGNYMYSKISVLNDIKKFIDESISK